MKRARKVIGPLIVYFGIGLLLISLPNGSRHFHPSEIIASAHVFNLLEWEIKNLPDKWVHQLTGLFLRSSYEEETDSEILNMYFSLLAEQSVLLRDMKPKYDNDVSQNIPSDLSDRVEEIIEVALTDILRSEGFGIWRNILLPPVDIKLGILPNVLIVSPRNKIEREYDLLLRSSVTVDDRERIENQLAKEANLSALVENIGGLATYPAQIPVSESLRWTLRTSAHEWIHHYLFFRPLGQNMFMSQDMVILNETLASIAGDEIGDIALDLFDYQLHATVKTISSPDTPVGEYFDFESEMRKLRSQVDTLLEIGNMEDAESLMNEKRLVFVANGYNIRKINQAYFAFYGSYGDSAASVSAIGPQLQELRTSVPDLFTFVNTVANVSTYEEFLSIISPSDGD